ncbi:MAG TPA: hypothetical protein VN108_09020 [Marmoricola sp.]|nr:hypothetical protein [Marmoricola sp.]
MGVVQTILVALCAISAIVVAIQFARNIPASNVVDALLALTELAVVAQLIAGLASLSSAPHDVSKFVYIGYLVGALIVLPIAWVWSQSERNRSGLGVLLVGLFVAAFLVVRLHQVWPHHG